MKTILVHSDRDNANVGRINAAFKIAEYLGAHVTGCHPIPPVNIYVPSSMVPVDGGQMIPQLMESAHKNAKLLKEEFAQHAPSSNTTWEWVETMGEPVDILIDEARLADITIVSQCPTSAQVQDPADIAGDLVVASGLPVLALPTSGKAPEGGHPALIAWNGSLEASRAIRAALPLLKRASDIHIVEVGEEKPSTLAAADIAPYLARYGLKVTTRSVEADDHIGETLLKTAHAVGAELVIMGAYGHSRLREFVLGGATRYMLHQNELPVFVNN